MVRLIFHALGAIILIVGIGFPSQISLFDRTVNTGVIGSILGVLYLVWLLNLFNFMDGTDGIAASEAIFVCVAGAILNFHVLSDINFSAAAIILASCTFGFLLYNWSPAKIFMGDVGSGYLGMQSVVFRSWRPNSNMSSYGCGSYCSQYLSVMQQLR
jgi:Fuc2NAc and GlcNAc transferase